MATLVATTHQESVETDRLSAFCQDVFGTLARSDQRRWGEVYVRGLLTVPGRKTIRRIAEHVVGEPVDQCLQQFVNQSPWRWEPVQEALTHWAATIRPRALVLDEVVFPKTGTSSAGVDRQYAGSAGRILNCQLGLAAMLVRKDAGCVVNWRLMLPKSWDGDAERRTRSHVPDTERHLKREEHVLRAIDEVATVTGRLRIPIIAASFQDEAQQLIRGLAERGMPYLVRIPGHTPVLHAARDRAITAAELAAMAEIRQILVPSPYGPEIPPARLRYSVAPVCDACLTRTQVFRCPHRRGQRIFAEWAPDGRRLRGVWLANITRICPHELVGLARLAQVRHQVMSALRNDFGLHDFEGRSFGGWHRHMTLVSAAHTLWTLERLREKGETVALRPEPARWDSPSSA
jgi:SRSO17 transposase